MSSTSIRTNRGDKLCIRSCCSFIIRQFNLNGPLSYAFIYGSWEIIRARKVGTTHTKVDYVVYRLFYPVILIGACLFAVVAEKDLQKFFSLIEVWSMILQITYAFIFLQNVLANNSYRDNVKHRQKIPERLVVTEEIEKGGHKLYICKRYSILPTERLYYTERFIWLLFNSLASINVAFMLTHVPGLIEREYRNENGVQDLRTYSFSMGLLILADVLLTPIPIRMPHVIFPLIYFTAYQCFLGIAYAYFNVVVYVNTVNASTYHILDRYPDKIILIIIIHSFLTMLGSLRDYIISLLDDSRTAKQLQNLRTQKRLARRKLMNYIEAPDGRIVGITLEKHNYTPGMDEYIKTENDKRKTDVSEEVVDSDESDVMDMNGKDGGGDKIVAGAVGVGVRNGKTVPKSYIVPLTAKQRSPPQLRYHVTTGKDPHRFTSSSSSEDEMTAIAGAIYNLPTPPKDSRRRGRENFAISTTDHKREVEPAINRRSSHQFATVVKPRDSKEDIHMKMDHHDTRDSPPTPPFVKLVQTLVKINRETKAELEQERKQKPIYSSYHDADGRTIQSRMGTALVKVVRAGTKDDKSIITEPHTGMPSKPTYRGLGQSSQPRPNKKARYADTKKRVSKFSSRKEADKPDEIDRLISDAIAPTPKFKSQQLKPTASKKTMKPDTRTNVKPGSKVAPAKAIASRVVHLKGASGSRANQPGEQQPGTDVSDFHQELTAKLEKEKKKSLRILDRRESRRGTVQQSRKSSLKKLKSILKHNEFFGDIRKSTAGSRVQRKQSRLLRRRRERVMLGKHGQPVYDPLSVPENAAEAKTSISTSFHFLGTKLTGERLAQTTVTQRELQIYRRHPGVGTTDEAQETDGGTLTEASTKTLVTFHPIVKYFDVNEVDKKTLRR